MGFITVNGRILDFAEYRKNVSALRFELAYEISECLSKYGFKIQSKNFKSYHSVCLLFINENSGLEAEFRIKSSCKKNYTDCIERFKRK